MPPASSMLRLPGHLFVLVSLALSGSLAALAGGSGECVHDPLEALQPDNYKICPPSEGLQSVLAFKDDINSGSPWISAPFCARDSEEVEKYCVYTSAGFNSETGVSFIIRPETLPEAAAFVQNTNLTQRGEKYLKERPQPGDADVAYEVTELAGKGRSVVTRQPIRRGEIFMVGFPAVVIDQELEIRPDPEISEQNRLRLYELAFGWLPDKQRALALAASTGGNVHEDIMRTNGFGIRIGNRKHSGLFPELARLNHACVPNAVVRFSATSLAMEVMAVRDIPAGEEITISYIPVDLPSLQRFEMLEAIYNFPCTCPLCSAPAAEKQASDQRRERIVAIRELLKDDQTSHGAAVELGRELLRLVQQEDLGFKLKNYYHDLMMAFYRLGDVRSATQFAEAALGKAEELSGGEDEFKAAIRANLVALKGILRGAKEKG